MNITGEFGRAIKAEYLETGSIKICFQVGDVKCWGLITLLSGDNKKIETKKADLAKKVQKGKKVIVPAATKKTTPKKEVVPAAQEDFDDSEV